MASETGSLPDARVTGIRYNILPTGKVKNKDVDVGWFIKIINCGQEPVKVFIEVVEAKNHSRLKRVIPFIKYSLLEESYPVVINPSEERTVVLSQDAPLEEEDVMLRAQNPGGIERRTRWRLYKESKTVYQVI